MGQWGWFQSWREGEDGMDVNAFGAPLNHIVVNLLGTHSWPAVPALHYGNLSVIKIHSGAFFLF